MQNESRDKQHKENAPSPFHGGEQKIQTRVGKREAMENFGQRAIRSYMPDQHREFYQQLPFIVAGSVDEQGWPWASVLSGQPGFINSPDPTTLTISASAIMGDPIAPQLEKEGSALGLLGIEMQARRRNRVNGRVKKTSSTDFSINVDQSFGNCPQYIQSRSIKFNNDSTLPTINKSIEKFTELSHESSETIRLADTFFVSSYVQTTDKPNIQGVDISHRGGRPGFVKVDGNTLTIPDYSGNNFYNTLGNFLVNPKAGLIFIDFSTGNLLMLTGSIELLWEDSPEVMAYRGAERAWRFTLKNGVTLKNALPFRASFNEYSPHSLIAGDWKQANATMAAEATRESWSTYTVKRIEDESSVIRSFYLVPNNGNSLASLKAGQFLTVRLTPPDSKDPIIRTYTVSSAPDSAYYRISVKREARGYFSKVLHDTLHVGDEIEAKAPTGDFYIDAKEKRPAVLIAAGVGITPMVAMTSHILNENNRTRYLRPLTILHSSQTTQRIAFKEIFTHAEEESSGKIRYYSFITRPNEQEKMKVNFDGSDHITAHTLRRLLVLDNYDFYLCGPPAFMQAIYNEIISLGVRDSRIFTESFGPAKLIRQAGEGSILALDTTKNEADEAMIKFSRSGLEQRWAKGDATLLETAEEHGLTPSFGCRNGSCGSCSVKLISGEVTYRTKPAATPTEGEILICCAVPKKTRLDKESFELDKTNGHAKKIKVIEIDL
jgi:ferredoxin-NADP reductase/predicted pyridoxine 5'-phosphate oxidase superfamily flavin-nucleotide-binding protein